MQPAQLVQYINTVHGTTFELVRQYPDGEQGAFALSDKEGRQGVLKWHPDASSTSRVQQSQTVTVTNLLRESGYPAPRYLLIGATSDGVYSIQEALPGSPIRHLTTAHLARLLELNALQRGRAIAGLRDWHAEAVHTVLSGGDGYCLHSSLQHHSRRTASLLEELQRLVLLNRDEPHRTNDIVHGDFQHANILLYNDQISGIIDWQAPSTGDCSFDLATLLFYSYDDLAIRERLWRYILAQSSLNLFSVYCAHLILRQVDWSLRHHERPIGERYIVRGETILREIHQINLLENTASM